MLSDLHGDSGTINPKLINPLGLLNIFTKSIFTYLFGFGKTFAKNFIIQIKNFAKVSFE